MGKLKLTSSEGMNLEFDTDDIKLDRVGDVYTFHCNDDIQISVNVRGEIRGLIDAILGNKGSS